VAWGGRFRCGLADPRPPRPSPQAAAGAGPPSAPAPAAPQRPARALEAAPALPRTAARRNPPPGAGDRPPTALPESAIFRDLQDAERLLDAALASRGASARDALRGAARVPKRLRVWARVEHAGDRLDPGDPPRWTLTLWGRLLDVAAAEVAARLPPPASGGRPFLAHVRSLSVELRPVAKDEEMDGAVKAETGGEGAPDAGAPAPGAAPTRVAWARTAAESRDLKDRVVVRRAWGGVPLEAVVTVVADGAPELATPDAALAAITGAAPDTRARLLRAVWAHVALRSLMGEGGAVACDAALAAVAGAPTATPAALAAAVAARAAPLPPPSFTVPIWRPDLVPGPGDAATAAHDYEVELPLAAGEGTGAGAAAALDAALHPVAAAAAAADLAVTLRRLREHARRRAFLLGFAAAPGQFIDALAAAHARELRVAKAAGAGATAVRASDAFRGPWVDDVAARLLARALPGGGGEGG